MDNKSAQLQARLKWEAACERLAFVLHPPTDAPAQEGAPDLESTLQLAQAALEEIRRAFGSEPGAEADR